MASKSRAMKTVTLKLVVDGGSKKVMYAEANKDFIDFLFGLLQIPIGSIITLLAGNKLQVSGSLSRVSQSLSNLGTSHFHSAELKKALENPHARRITFSPPLLLRNFSWELTFEQNGDGYVKENCTYMVLDDLVVSPMSSIPVLALLKSVNIRLLEEKTVEIDLNKVLELVKASLESNTVLTDVFIPK